MLIVDGYELSGHVVGIEFLLIVRDKCVHELLPAVTTGHGSDKILAKLLGSFCDGVLHYVAGAQQFHQRTDVGLFRGIDRCWSCLSRSGRVLMCRLHGVLRRSLDY